MIINLGVSITEEAQTGETDIKDAPPDLGQCNYHWDPEEIIIGYYTEGTVTLDLVDVVKGEMIWQAVSTGVLRKKQAKNKKKIVKAVKKLFMKYPVKAVSR